jgi:hypothetical protein
MVGACTSPRGLPVGTRWDAKNGVIPWGSPARTLGPKGGWLWRLTSPGNEDVLMCINAPFMTQRVLKPWWSWTYQNSAVKRAAAKAIPGWVTSWEVWYGEPKADSIVSLGVDRYNWVHRSSPSFADLNTSLICKQKLAPKITGFIYQNNHWVHWVHLRKSLSLRRHPISLPLHSISFCL